MNRFKGLFSRSRPETETPEPPKPEKSRRQLVGTLWLHYLQRPSNELTTAAVALELGDNRIAATWQTADGPVSEEWSWEKHELKDPDGKPASEDKLVALTLSIEEGARAYRLATPPTQT